MQSMEKFHKDLDQIIKDLYNYIDLQTISEIFKLNEEINSLIEQRKILESEKAYLLKENNALKEKLNCEK